MTETWTPEEVHFVRMFFADMTAVEMAAELSRPPDEVEAMLQALGLVVPPFRPGQEYWGAMVVSPAVRVHTRHGERMKVRVRRDGREALVCVRSIYRNRFKCREVMVG
jgi:hypothetical protein